MSGDGVESFYGDFWTDSVWAGAKPNDDELNRLTAIDRIFLEKNLGGRILDVGCGRGVITAALARHGDIVGIDVVEAGIEVGREIFPDLDLRHSELSELNHSLGGSFDTVVSTEVLEHVEARAQQGFVADMYAALKPGGHLVLTTPRGQLQQAWRAHVPHEQPREDWVTEAELDVLIDRAGFQLVTRDRTMVYPITRWRKLFVIGPTRRLAARVPVIDRLVRRAGIYQIVVARKPG